MGYTYMFYLRHVCNLIYMADIQNSEWIATLNNTAKRLVSFMQKSGL